MTATFNLVANVSTLVLASTQPEIVAGWRGSVAPALSVNDLTAVIEQIRERAYIVVDPITGQHGVATGGGLVDEKSAGAWPVIAVLPAMYPEWLGDRSFNEVHGTRFPYVTGAMANGIATTQLVIAMARTGCLGFFGVLFNESTPPWSNQHEPLRSARCSNPRLANYSRVAPTSTSERTRDCARRDSCDSLRARVIVG